MSGANLAHGRSDVEDEFGVERWALAVNVSPGFEEPFVTYEYM